MDDDVSLRRSRIKDLLESKLRTGTLEAVNTASVFEKENGWMTFNKKKPHIVKIQGSRTTETPSLTSVGTSMETKIEKTYRLSQEDDASDEDPVNTTENIVSKHVDDFVTISKNTFQSTEDKSKSESDSVNDAKSILRKTEDAEKSESIPPGKNPQQDKDNSDYIPARKNFPLNSNNEDNKSKSIITKNLPIDDDNEPSSDFITTTENPLLMPDEDESDDDDAESDEYADIDDEKENWMTIELTTPLAVPSSTERITIKEDSFYTTPKEIPSSTSPPRLPSAPASTRPPRLLPWMFTTSPSNILTTIPVFSTRKHQEDYVTKPPLIHVTKDLLRKLQPPEVIHKDHRHRWKEQYEFQAPNTTLVTALLDIGRGHWHTYGRPLERYHLFMSEVLKLKVPLIAFVDDHSFEFVMETRKRLGLEKMTKVHKITLEDLPLSRHLDVMKAIIHHELHGTGWQRDWDPAMRTHPEAKSAAYDLVVNSKPYFVHNASSENPFRTHYFAWIDAGYGQGKPEYFPRDYFWRPHFPPGKISLAKVTPYYDDISRYSLKDLYRQDRAVISGGFFGGDQEAIEKLYHRYNGKFVELLFRYRIVDDDQTTFVLVINEAPKLFNVLHADWFDAFKLFRK